MEIAVLNNLDIIVENPIVGNLIVLSVGLDRYQYSVSVSGRYQWYRFGIGIADTAADTRTDTGRP